MSLVVSTSALIIFVVSQFLSCPELQWYSVRELKEVGDSEEHPRSWTLVFDGIYQCPRVVYRVMTRAEVPTCS